MKEKNEYSFLKGLLLVVILNAIFLWFFVKANPDWMIAICTLISTIFIGLTAIWAKESFWLNKESEQLKYTIDKVDDLNKRIIKFIDYVYENDEEVTHLYHWQDSIKNEALTLIDNFREILLLIKIDKIHVNYYFESIKLNTYSKNLLLKIVSECDELYNINNILEIKSHINKIPVYATK
jgi:hypothetical protein